MHFSASQTKMAVLFLKASASRGHTTLKLGVRGRGEGKKGSKIHGCFFEEPRMLFIYHVLTEVHRPGFDVVTPKSR